jgi:hypothetical protein
MRVPRSVAVDQDSDPRSLDQDSDPRSPVGGFQDIDYTLHHHTTSGLVPVVEVIVSYTW